MTGAAAVGGAPPRAAVTEKPPADACAESATVAVALSRADRNLSLDLARSLAPGGVTRAAAFGRGTIPVVYAPPPLLELYPDTESNDLDGSILPAWVRMRSLADLLLLCRSSRATFASFAAASDGRERADDDSDDRCLDPSTDGSLGWTPRWTGDGAGDGPGDTSAAPTRGGLRLGGIVDPSAKRWGAS